MRRDKRQRLQTVIALSPLCFRPADQEEPSVLPLLCAGFSRVRPAIFHNSCLHQAELVNPCPLRRQLTACRPDLEL